MVAAGGIVAGSDAASLVGADVALAAAAAGSALSRGFRRIFWLESAALGVVPMGLVAAGFSAPIGVASGAGGVGGTVAGGLVAAGSAGVGAGAGEVDDAASPPVAPSGGRKRGFRRRDGAGVGSSLIGSSKRFSTASAKPKTR
jgi:hypothetical protein